MWRFFLLLLLMPLSLSAATVRLVPSSLPVRVGTPVTLTIFADTANEAVNAIEGSLVYDEDYLTFTEASDKDSSILFWIAYPKQCALKTICLSGISPGGFNGPAHTIASVTFTPKQIGTTTVSLAPIRILKHDGKGTDTDVLSEPLGLVIEEKLSGDVLQLTQEIDTEPPEVFSPYIVADPLVHDGAFVLIFETKDKQTKIAGYQVREYGHPFLAWLARWKEAESPYVLRDQDLQSFVEVKAIDALGNERIMTIPPGSPATLPSLYVAVILGLFILLGSVLIFRLKRNLN